MECGFRDAGLEPAVGDLDGLFEGVAQVVGGDCRKNYFRGVGSMRQGFLDEIFTAFSADIALNRPFCGLFKSCPNHLLCRLADGA